MTADMLTYGIVAPLFSLPRVFIKCVLPGIVVSTVQVLTRGGVWRKVSGDGGGGDGYG